MTADLRCVAWEEVADWWAGDLPAARAEELEEHLLTCTACSRRAERMGDLVRAVAIVARSGAVAGPAAPGFVDRIERDGLQVHRYRIGPGQVIPCSVWPEDEVMAAVLDVHALLGDQGGRLDVVARVGDQPAVRVEDVPVDPAARTVTWLSPAALERRRPVTRVEFQVIRVSADGQSVAAEYALAHEPWNGSTSPR